MKLTVLGGWGGWPAAGGACGGYLLEHDGFRLLIDPGYAVVSKLLELLPADAVDAVLVSHGHPDHCADVNPLLRVRAFMDQPPPPLPLFALPEALDAVLALDRASMLGDAYELHEFEAGEPINIGPFVVQTALLPHPRPNTGIRVEAGGASLAYTGDAGPSAAMVELARDVDLLLAEASYAAEVPAESHGALSSARDAGALAAMPRSPAWSSPTSCPEPMPTPPCGPRRRSSTVPRRSLSEGCRWSSERQDAAGGP